MTLGNKSQFDMIHVHLEKSEEAYKDAVLLFESRKSFNGSANRVYYAMFHAEKALLLTRGILGDSHKHVHTQLSNQFVKEGQLPDNTGRDIRLVENIRYVADYSGEKSVTKEEVEEALAKTKNFIEQVKELLHTHSGLESPKEAP